MTTTTLRLPTTPAIIIVSMVVSLLFPVHSAATSTEGLTLLGFGLSWSNIGSDDQSSTSDPDDVYVDDTGIGGMLAAGYGFGPALAIRLEASVTAHNTSNPEIQFTSSNLLAEMLYIFRDMETWRPYIFGGVGGFAVKSKDNELEIEITGPGLSAGAGFYYFFSDNFTIDASLRGDFINWSEAKATLTQANGSTFAAGLPIDESGSAARIGIGGSWWF